MKKFFTTLFFTTLFLLVFFPAKSFAADIFFNSAKNQFAPNEKFSIDVYADTKDTIINAVGGSVSFPSDLIKFNEVRYGNSTLNFWVEKPHLVSNGKIIFSGITPGGFSGPKVFLFSIIFTGKGEGTNTLNLNDVEVLQNDGEGSAMPSTGIPFAFSVNSLPNGTQIEDLDQTDVDPPESFTPYIASDPSIFDGKYFLVFNAVDKGVGIDHYEVREGIWNDYVLAESPYLLADQTLSQDIIVKAVDKAGNKRLEKIKAQNTNYNFQIIVVVVIIFLVCFYFWKRRSSKPARS